MRAITVLGLLSSLLASQAFATNPHADRANFWQIHFDAGFGGDPAKPVVVAQAHIGEALFSRDVQGNPNWDQHQALVTLSKVRDHFYASAELDHDTNPEITGGYKAPVIQYHYFLKGEEYQIDPNAPYAGGHWTVPLEYLDGSADQGTGPFMISKVLNEVSPNDYDQARAQVSSQMPDDAQETSVIEVKLDYAD